MIKIELLMLSFKIFSDKLILEMIHMVLVPALLATNDHNAVTRIIMWIIFQETLDFLHIYCPTVKISLTFLNSSDVYNLSVITSFMAVSVLSISSTNFPDRVSYTSLMKP